MRLFRWVGDALLLLTIPWLLTGRPLRAEILIHFDQDVYFVTGPGDTIEARISLDADPATDRDDGLMRGLFSFGAATDFDATKAQVGSVADIAAAARLDFFGFAAGSFESVAAGFAGVKGNIDQLVNPLVPYGGTLLAKITFTNLATGPDSYPLGLDFFNTLGANEQLFLDGTGTVLDPQIRFRSARVVVIPEPTAGALWLLAAVACACWSRSGALAVGCAERQLRAPLPEVTECSRL